MLLASSEERPASPTTKDYVVHNANSAEMKKPCAKEGGLTGCIIKDATTTGVLRFLRVTQRQHPGERSQGNRILRSCSLWSPLSVSQPAPQLNFLHTSDKPANLLQKY